MYKKLSAVITAVLALSMIMLSACNSGGGDGGGGEVTPANSGDLQISPDMSAVPESMTPDQRDAAMEKVRQYRLGIYTGGIDVDNQAVVDYIRTLTTEFSDAGIMPDKTVWARFIDGYPVIFVYKTLPPGTPIPTFSTNANQAVGVVAAAEIPQGDKAVLIDVDTLATNSLATIEPALKKKGYVTSRPKGTVADFMAIKDVSVFFISSHGGACKEKDGTASYCILTNEQKLPYDPTDAHSVNMKSLYDSGEIIMTGVEAHDTDGNLLYSTAFLAITQKFIENNWSKTGSKAFTPNSLVAIDTCQMFFDHKLTAASDQAPYTNFRGALYGAGANALLGWNDEVGKVFASDTMQLFFDRALGANAYQSESPKQRPFPYRPVIDWMATSNKQCEGSGACLTLTEHNVSGQFVPTIHNANIYNVAPGAQYAGKWVLEVAGEFGSDTGAVTVDGTALPLLGPWAHDNLKVELPPSMDGPGSYGDLIVTVRSHQSNPVPLTKWTGTISQSQIDENIGAGAHFDISCPVQGTADVHAARAQPSVTPLRTSIVEMELSGPCSYSMSGTWSAGTTRWDLSGSGSVSPVETTPVIGSLTSASLTGDAKLPASFLGTVGLVLGTGAAGTLRETNTSDGSHVDYTVYGNWGLGGPYATLGADYSFTANRTCSVTPQCNETWSLTPDATPLPDTES